MHYADGARAGNDKCSFCNIIRSDVVFAEVVFYYAAVIIMNDKQHKTTERSVISCSHCGFSPYKTPVQGSLS